MNAQHKNLAWDDLRSVLAVVRGGTLSKAARDLGLNHSTVFRRIAAIESKLGQPLFDRLATGYRPTALGEELAAVAERMEAEVQALQRRIGGRDQRLGGRIRLTAPDDLADHLLVEPLARFQAAYPEIRLEMIVDNRMLNLTRREADLAVRPTGSPESSLIGRRVARLASAIYAAASSFDGIAGRSEVMAETRFDAARFNWIGWEEDAEANRLKAWLDATVPPECITYRCNSLVNQFHALKAGMGLAVLPCFLGDSDPNLRRLALPEGLGDIDLWILSHADLRQSARVRALADFLFQELKRQRSRLAGRSPSR